MRMLAIQVITMHTGLPASSTVQIVPTAQDSLPSMHFVQHATQGAVMTLAELPSRHWHEHTDMTQQVSLASDQAICQLMAHHDGTSASIDAHGPVLVHASL